MTLTEGTKNLTTVETRIKNRLAGATEDITPSKIDPKNKKAKLIIKTNSTLKEGNYTITITGRGEGTGVESKVTVNLAVGVLPDIEPGRISATNI